MRARAPERTTKTKASKPAASPRRAPKVPAAPPVKTEKPEVRIFVSYSHRDGEARARLETHLAPLKRDRVETWFDGGLDAGDKLETGIARALREAHVFVALLSSDYLASNYCWNIEYRRAMNRRARGTMRVIAVVLRPCDWKSTQAAGFKLLPEDGREVTRWRSADTAFLNVAQGIRRVVAAVRRDMAAKAGEPKAIRRTASPKAKPPPSIKRAASPKSRKALVTAVTATGAKRRTGVRHGK